MAKANGGAARGDSGKRNLLRGHIDFSLLLPVAIPIALGLVAGNRLAPHIPAHILKKAIGLLCLVIGAAQCIRAVWG